MRDINSTVLAQLQAEELRPFLLLDMTIDSTHYRYTDCDVPINYDGNTYAPMGFRAQPIQYSMNRIVDQVQIEIDNLDSVMTSLFVGGTPQGSNVTLKLVLMDNDWHILGQPWGLVAAYDFDEGEGTTLHDRSGNGNDGTIYGEPEWVTGKSGYALDFDGTDDYVSIPDDTSLNFGLGDFSVSWWMNFNPGTSQERWSMGKGRPYLSAEPGWAISNWTTGDPITPQLFVSDGIGEENHFVNFASMSRGTWYHLAFVVDRSTNTIKTYLNSVYCNTLDISALGSFDNTSYDLWLGKGNAVSNYSDVRMDEVRIYNRALSEAEISYLYNNPGQGMSAGAVTLFEGEIDSWILDEERLQMTVTSIFNRWSQRTLSRHSASCRWKKFKGTECGYSGSATWCDRTYARCQALGNAANFGGFRWLPSIIGKEIWWGGQSK